MTEPEDDELLARVYTNVVTADIYRKKFLPFVIFSDSLSSSAPLKRLIKKNISNNTLARVAKAGREEGRGLYVGTVNLDTGRLVIWDLVKIAGDLSNPKRLDLYREVVLASASIPVMVPPGFRSLTCGFDTCSPTLILSRCALSTYRSVIAATR